MKKYFLILIVLLLCGCSAEYQLKIDGSKISEEINFSVVPAQFKEEELAPDLSIYSKDSLEYLKNADIPAIQGSQKYIYEKTVTEQDNLLYINLKYNYQNDQLQDSRVLNECFENNEIQMDKGKISIHLSGKFQCLNDSSDSAKFKIVTNNKVESANINYGVLDNEYVWEIDFTNRNNVDIQIDMLTESKYQYYGIRIIIGAVLLIMVGIGIFMYYKISNRKDINKI